MSESPTRSKPHSMLERIAELHTRRDEAMAGGGEKRHEKQHAAGKLTARERIAEFSGWTPR
jgi:methylmalonyl-CoA carboxyltransferase large subunit